MTPLGGGRGEGVERKGNLYPFGGKGARVFFEPTASFYTAAL